MENIISKLPLKKGENLKNVLGREDTDLFLKYLHTKHLEGESLASFQRCYGVTKKTLRNNFRRLSLPIINHQNKLRVRADLFDSITTEEDAYWLGFIYADGCIQDLGTLSLELKGSDVAHLQKFKKYCNWQNTVKVEKASFNSTRARLAFSGKGKELNALGVLPRKSLNLEFPSEDILKKELQVYFIRGYFDGDGCYYIYTPKKKTQKDTHVCSILGTQQFLNTLRDICPISTNSFRTKGNLYVLAYNNLKADAFLDWVYKDSKIHLDRKYNKYLTHSPSIE